MSGDINEAIYVIEELSNRITELTQALHDIDDVPNSLLSSGDEWKVIRSIINNVLSDEQAQEDGE